MNNELNIKSIDEVLDISQNIYLWEDNKTLDVCHFEQNSTFNELIQTTRCLRCQTSLILGNEKFLAYMTETVKGIKLTCCKCKQKYFIHMHVSMIDAHPKN